MSQLPFLNVLKKFKSFRIFLLITIIFILSNTGNLLAMPLNKMNELHRNCNFCHFSNGSPRILSSWNDNTQGKNFSFLKESEFKNKIHSSKLCLSCHDGAIAQDQAINMNEEGQINPGVDLGKSHPVSVDYMTSYSGRGPRNLHHPSNLYPLKLYDGKVECGTCHETHQSFRIRTSKNDLCFRCHNM